jgi:leucyl aminopeptidase (aminopeptidase T)
MLRNDERYEKLAKTLVEFSINLPKGERVLLNNIDILDDMTIALI